MATHAEVAAYFDVTTKTIQNWSKIAGFPNRRGKGGLDIREVVIWRVRYLESTAKNAAIRDTFGSDDDSLETLEREEQILKNEERKVRTRAHAFKLSVLESEFVPIAIIPETLSRVSQSMGTVIDTFVPSIKQLYPDIDPRVLTFIGEQSVKLCNTLAEVQPDLSDFTGCLEEGDQQWIDAIAEEET